MTEKAMVAAFPSFQCSVSAHDSGINTLKNEIVKLKILPRRKYLDAATSPSCRDVRGKQGRAKRITINYNTENIE